MNTLAYFVATAVTKEKFDEWSTRMGRSLHGQNPGKQGQLWYKDSFDARTALMQGQLWYKDSFDTKDRNVREMRVPLPRCFLEPILYFFGSNIQVLVISYSVGPWQEFPAWSIVCGQGQEPSLEWGTWKVLQLSRLLFYQQTIDLAGKACFRQTLQLITNIRKLRL